VGLATLDYIEQEKIVERAAENGAYLLERLHAELDDHPHVGNVRGKGMMCGVELVEDRDSKSWYPPEWGVGPKMTRALIGLGIFTRMRNEVICIAPPLTTERETLDELVAGVRNAVIEVFGE
jgi:L-2,4-diaminobutyrate transaminase